MPATVSAQEINCLIHSYLEDSGFIHSAFAIRMEGQLDHTPHFKKHIPRGELVELLTKALLYVEVEAHWKEDGLNCRNGFSLLERHICSLQPTMKSAPRAPFPTEDVVLQNNENLDSLQNKGNPEPLPKRKAEAPADQNGHIEKRARTEEKMDVVDEVDPSRLPEQPPPPPKSPEVPANGSIKKPKPRRLPGPADESTDPDAIQLLLNHETEVFVCAWNPVKHGLLATGSKDAVVHIWNIPGPPPNGSGRAPRCTETPLKLAHFTKPESADLTCLDWNPDGSLLAIGSYDAILRVCDADGALYFSNSQHEGPIFATRFSKSGRWLLTASLDGTTCVWDVPARKLHVQYRCHGDCCLDVDWLDDDTTFASCGADKMIHVMKLGEVKPIKTLVGHTNEINQVKCNPKRTRMASCSDDKTARIWTLEPILNRARSDHVPAGSDEVIILNGHRGSVSSVVWCPITLPGQNELLASSGFDGTARIWDSVTGDCLKVFSDHKRPVYALSFSPEGRWLATGSGDGWMHVYDVRSFTKTWSWYAGSEKPGVYEIDWQQTGNVNRIALALESRHVGVVDITRISALQKA